ncbi:MAG: hypothetical protein PUF72_06500 [Clostridiales bacterium]|nr:hypothetical protein [Clostridiales bacterium]
MQKGLYQSKGITFNIDCSKYGGIQADCENCTISLYLIKLFAGSGEIKSIHVLVVITEDNTVINDIPKLLNILKKIVG